MVRIMSFCYLAATSTPAKDQSHLYGLSGIIKEKPEQGWADTPLTPRTAGPLAGLCDHTLRSPSRVGPQKAHHPLSGERGTLSGSQTATARIHWVQHGNSRALRSPTPRA